MADQTPPDKGLAVQFSVEAVENPRKSKEAGRPIYDNREKIKIQFPGDNKRVLSAFADEMHYVSHLKQQMTYAERFPEHYAAFKANHEAEYVDGTPLSELPALTEAKRAELRAQNIKTVEQLAALPDASLRSLGMGARDMMTSAQAYLAKAADTGEVAALKRQVEDLKAMVAAQSAPAASADEFDGMEDEDLRNILKGAGAEFDGRWGRGRLISEIQKLAKAKEAA